MILPKRTNAQVWRAEAAPEDTSPHAPAPRPSLEDWGVTAQEARAMLARQVCPVCSEGPWKSPLNHASRKHGIDRFTMRDLCGITVAESVTDPELRERNVERGKSIDMSTVNHKGKPRAKQRWTTAGIERNRATLAQWESEDADRALGQRRAASEQSKSPTARQRQGDSLKRWYEEHPEARAAARDRLTRSPEELSRQAREAWARRGVRPCGTVAAYKRGCRCDECREAKRASR